MIKIFKNICKAQNVSYFWTLACWLYTLYLISKIFKNKLQSGSSVVHCPNSFEKGIALDCLQEAQLVNSPQGPSHCTILSFWALVTIPQSASQWLKTENASLVHFLQTQASQQATLPPSQCLGFLLAWSLSAWRLSLHPNPGFALSCPRGQNDVTGEESLPLYHQGPKEVLVLSVLSRYTP